MARQHRYTQYKTARKQYWSDICMFTGYLSFGRAYFLIFIFAVLHASAKLFNARWRPDSVEESRTKSSANSRRLILQFPIVAHSSAWLHLSIQFM